jgi:hypothetical protein
MVQSGFTFTGSIEYNVTCFDPPPVGTIPFPVGRLAPGSYSVTVQGFYTGSIVPTTTQTGAFSVAAQGDTNVIPTLDPIGIALIAVLILLTAVPRLVRR